MPQTQTQLEQARDVIIALYEIIISGGVPELTESLNTVLGHAQNAPEYGGLSDGTIDVPTRNVTSKTQKIIR